MGDGSEGCTNELMEKKRGDPEKEKKMFK